MRQDRSKTTPNKKLSKMNNKGILEKLVYCRNLETEMKS